MICTVMLLIVTTSLFAFSYPISFHELMLKFYEEKTKIEVVLITEKKYEGEVILSRDDYFVFRLTNEDVIIILYSAVAEVTLVGD